MNISTIISTNLQDSIDLKSKILQDESLLKSTQLAVQKIISCYKNSGAVYMCGNGGSAADAQHLAAELSGKYYIDRAALKAEALHVNTSYLTAVANDYSFEDIYARLIAAWGNKGDILIAFSTSGSSINVLKALEQAKSLEVYTIGFCGANSKYMQPFCNLIIEIPSLDTPRIQECHMLLGHTICQLVEQELFDTKL